MLRPPSLPIPGLDEEVDELFRNAVEVVVQYERASPSLLQRRLEIGYARASRLIDQLETAGVVGPAAGSQPREVLIRSYEEFVARGGKPPEKEEEDVFKVPANYRVPSDLKLSTADDITWGTQLSDVIQRTEFKDSNVDFALHLGFDDEGSLHTESLLDVKNLIVAGNPLSQKENLIDSFLLTYLLRYDPSQLKLILADSTHYLDLYNGIPHLLSPVINEHGKVISAFMWASYEMDRRFKQFGEAGVRDIHSFNENAGSLRLPYILVITFVDFFDIETEDLLTRLTAQGARAGIHNILVVGQNMGKSLPSTIKANIPARAVFRLSSAGESRAIDVAGGEKLEPGELIYKPNYGSAVNLKAIFTPEVNVKDVVEVVKKASTHA